MTQPRVVVKATQETITRTSTAEEEIEEEGKIEAQLTSTTRNIISTVALPRPKISRPTISTVRFENARTTTTLITKTTTTATTTTATTTIATTTTRTTTTAT